MNRRPLFEQFGRMLTAVGNTPTMVTGEGARQQKWPLRRVRRPTHFAFIADTPYHRGVWGISLPRTVSPVQLRRRVSAVSLTLQAACMF